MNRFDDYLVSTDIRERFFALVDSLSALRSLSQIDLADISEKELLAECLSILLQHQDLDTCAIFLLQDNVLYCAESAGLEEVPKEVEDIYEPTLPTFAIGEGLIGKAFKNSRLEYCRNCKDDEDFTAFVGSRLSFDSGSMMAIPISSGQAILGVLHVAHPLPEFFEPWHQHMLTLFTGNLGQMLGSHRLLHDLETEVESRTQDMERALAEAMELSRRYQALVSIDELTGLRNRRHFFIESQSALARAHRQQEPISLLLIDIDNFKRVNNALGHTQGDDVLKQVAGVLDCQARAGDIIGRVGGEEFCILLSHSSREGADRLAQRIQEAVAVLDIAHDSMDTGLSVSIGMASWDGLSGSEITQTFDGLFSQADSAMYACKRQGKNQRLFFSEDLVVNY